MQGTCPCNNTFPGKKYNANHDYKVIMDEPAAGLCAEALKSAPNA
jgi:hypothetical protein